MTTQQAIKGQEEEAMPQLPPAKLVGYIPTAQELNTLRAIADNMARSGMSLPKDSVRAEALLTKMLIGRELGLAPMQSVYEIQIIEGQSAMKARTKIALIRRRGLGNVEVQKSTPTDAVVRVTRADWPDGRSELVSWNLTEAQQADLLGKLNWKRYPQDMLLARAMDRACKLYFQEVFLGVASSPDELGAETDETGAAIDLTMSNPGGTVDTPPWVKATEDAAVASAAASKAAEAAAEASTKAADAIAASIADQAVVAAEPAKLPEPGPDPAPMNPYGTTAADIRNRCLAISQALHLDQQAWSGIVQRFGGMKLGDLPHEQQIELKGHLERMHAVSVLRKFHKISDENWTAIITKRGVQHLHQFTQQQITEMYDKLWGMTPVFERRSLGLEAAPVTAPVSADPNVG